MRILWIHQYYATPAGWGSGRTHAFARRFRAAGHDVDILTSAAYDASLTGRRQVEIDGMRVWVSGVRYRPQMGFLARLTAFLAFAAFSLGFVLRRGRRYDLIIASSAPLTTALPAFLARRLYGVPFVFEVIDVWPDAAIAAGVLHNPLLIGLSRRLEAAAYRQAARIVTCSTGMTERVISKGVAEAKVVTISNSCDLDWFRPDAAERARTRAAQGVGAAQMVVLYTGAMGLSNAIDDVAAAVRATVDAAEIVWWFAGDGAESGKLCGQAESATGGRVRFFGKVAKPELARLGLAADVALVTFRHEPFFYENSPNKFFDALAAGLPVVFNRSTWLEPWLEQYGNGIVCREQPPELAGVLRRLAAQPEERRRMGAAARRLAEEVFSRDLLAIQYEKLLLSLI